MSIAQLKKVTLLGLNDKKLDAIKAIQALGVMHVIPLSDSEAQLRRRPHSYYDAVKYLSDCPEKRTPITIADNFDAEDMVEQTLANKSNIRETGNRRDKIRRYIRELETWGDFDFPSEEELNGRKLYFYKVPGYKRNKIKAKKGFTIQEVKSGNRNAYIVVISKEEPTKAMIPGDKIELGPMSLTTARREFQRLTIQLEDLEAERHSLTRYLPLLLRDLHKIEDQTIYEYVCDRTFDEDAYFALQGWIPENDLDDVSAVAEEFNLAIVQEKPSADDKPPTYFQNSDTTAPGEDLVKFYQMPAYKAWDPSSVLYFSFAIFFAMIMSDAGYALAIGALMMLFWRKMCKSEGGQRFRRMGMLLTFTSFIYGMLVGSYFGVTPSGGLISDIHILDVNDFDIMMKISIIAGVIHIVLANAIMAWNTRYSFNALSYIGWILGIVGATTLWLVSPQYIPGQVMMVTAGLLVLLFTSQRPLNSFKNIALRFTDGLLGVTNVSKAFGDILSYMRLFALGLASASLAVMFNQLAGQVSESVAGIGTFLAIAVLVLGHSLNFTLAIIGGVVHGLRLNLIEFFSWSLTDEGYEYKPFQLKEKKLWKI